MDYDQLRGITGSIGTVFFFVFFLCVLAWVFRPGAKKKLDADAKIPFLED